MKPIINDIALALWRLLPANPIVVRVVQGGSKRIQHLWVRAGYLVILLFVMLIMQVVTENSSDSLAAMAKASSQIFESISILQLAMMCFLAPIFTAGAISQEKDADTYNVLLTTPLTNTQIVLGSLLSRLFFVLILLLAGLPIFCITMLFGGVTGDQIFQSFCIAGCTAVLTGSLAIMISIIRVGTRGTIFSFYLGIALYLGIGLALGNWSKTYVPESILPGSTEGMTWLALIHPYWALLVGLNQIHPPDPATVQHYMWPLNTMLAKPHVAYITLTILASLMMVAIATIFVRRGAKQGELNLWARIRSRWLRVGTTTTSGEKTRKPRRVWYNPVAWREAVTRASAASSNMVRYSYMICGIVAAILLFFTYATGQFASVNNARNWLTGIVIIEFATVMLMAANTAATAITRERESGTMELLLTTPLTSRYIVWGKLRGLISFTIPLMAIPAATVLLFAFYDFFTGANPRVVYMGSALLLPPLLMVYSAFVCLLGLHMSLKNKRSVQAVLASIGILVAVGFGLSLCAYNIVTQANQIGALMAPLTFVTAVWMVLNPDLILEPGVGGSLGVTDIQIFMFVGTAIAVGLYGAIVAGTYRSMVTNFDMIVRKQSQ